MGQVVPGLVTLFFSIHSGYGLHSLGTMKLTFLGQSWFSWPLLLGSKWPELSGMSYLSGLSITLDQLNKSVAMQGIGSPGDKPFNTRAGHFRKLFKDYDYGSWSMPGNFPRSMWQIMTSCASLLEERTAVACLLGGRCNLLQRLITWGDHSDPYTWQLHKIL